MQSYTSVYCGKIENVNETKCETMEEKKKFIEIATVNVNCI